MMTNITSEMKQPVPPAQDAKQARRRRNRILVIVGAVVLLIALGIGAFVYAMIAWKSSIKSPASVAANKYYAAIQHQQYATAYAYLDTRLTYNGTLITEDGYTQVATRLDITEGRVIAYSVSNVSTSWNFGQNSATSTIHVTRAHQSYDVHLGLQLEGNTYKVRFFDGI